MAVFALLLYAVSLSMLILDNVTGQLGSGVTVGFEMTTYLVGEDDVNGQGETVEVCAVITEGLLQGRAVTLVFVTGTGTATNNVDYNFLADTRILDSVSNGRECVNVSILPDGVVEGTETLPILLATFSPDVTISPSSATILIIDNDVQIGWQPSNYQTAEGMASARACATVIAGSGNIGARSIDVQVSSSGITAQGGGTDFGSPTPSTFTFMTSQTTQCTDIPINNDLLVEGSTDETFNIMLAQIVPADPNTQLSPATAIVSIDDNDVGIMRLSQSAYTVDENGTAVSVNLVLDSDSGTLLSDIVVEVTADTQAGDTATVDEDFIGATCLTTFTSASSAGTITVPTCLFAIGDDDLVELAETFSLSAAIINSNAQPAQFSSGGDSASVTINSDDGLIFQFRDTPIDGPESLGDLEVVVVLATGSGNLTAAAAPVIIQVQTVPGGTATVGASGDHLDLASGPLPFDIGNSSQSASIIINEDSLIEGTESILLSATIISDPSGRSQFTSGGITATNIANIVDNDVGIFRFNQSTYNVNENADTVLIVMELTPSSGILTTSVVIRVQSMTGGTATEGAGGDYLGIGATDLTFTSSSGPGDSMSVSITILDDNLEESTETILLEASILSDPQFSQFAPGGNTTTVNINDDEEPLVQAGFESLATSVMEGQTAVQVCAAASNPAEIGARTLAVSISASGGSAQGGGTDYGTLPTSTLTFTALNFRQCINISITDDNLVEGPESFSLSLSANSADIILIVPSTSVEIADNDVAIFRFNPNTYTVAENVASGVQDVSLQLVSGTLTFPINVLVQVTGGTATATADFSGPALSLVTFLVGDGANTNRSTTYTIVNDTALESDETITMNGTSQNALGQFQASGDTAVITILDDDAVPLAVHLSSTIYNAAEGTPTVAVCVDADNPAVIGGRTIQVNIVATPGTAQGGGVDYGPITCNPLVLPGTDSQVCCNIPIIDDFLSEGTEVFTVTVVAVDTNANVVPPATATVAIADNDVAIFRFNPNTYTVAENVASGVQDVSLQLVSGTLTFPINVLVQVTGGTATATADFSGPAPSLVTFLVGDGANTNRSTTYTIVNDTALESDETITMNGTLQNALGQFLPGGDTAVITILDDEAIPLAVHLSSIIYNAAEGTPTVAVCVNADNPAVIGGRMIQVIIVATPGSAQGGGVDYGPITCNPLVFPGTDSQECCNIPIIDDFLSEGTEVFTVTVVAVDTNANVIPPATATVAIADNDAGIFRFNQSTYNVNENANTVLIVMELTPSSGILTTSVVIRVQNVTGGTATEGAGGDYLGIGATDLTFTSSSGPGDSMSVSITILDDNLGESTETILLEASILSGQQFAQFSPGGNTASVSINDDEVAFMRFSLAAYSQLESNTTLAVSLVLDAFGGTGTGPSSITQNIDGQITALVQVGDTATEGAGGDFIGITCPVTFPSGSGPGTSSTPACSITINNDRLVELAETFSLTATILNSRGLSAQFSPGGNAASATINDDEIAFMRFSLAAYSQSETISPLSVSLVLDAFGGTGTGPSSITQDIDEQITALVLAGDIATIGAGGDFIGITCPVTFPSGSGPGNSSTPACSITINNDRLVELVETFSLTATILNSRGLSARFSPGGNAASATINDDEIAFMKFTLAAYSQNESNTTLSVNLVLDPFGGTGTGPQSITQDILEAITALVPAGDTATEGAGGDFIGITCLVTFPSGSGPGTSSTPPCSIAINNDNIYENDETFSLIGTIQNTNGLSASFTAGGNSASATIIDDEVVTVHLVSMDPASGTIGLPDVSVPESGADPRLCVRLDLAGGLTIARTVSVTLSTVAGGTAQVNQDYVPISSPITFNQSTQNQSVCRNITVNDDLICEADETIPVSLTTAEDPNEVRLSPPSATMTIIDDDVANVGFDRTSYTVTEFEDPQLNFNVQILSGQKGPGRSCVVTVSTLPDSATSPEDFTALSTSQPVTVTLSSTTTSVSLSIIIADDLLLEPTEHFNISLSTGSDGCSISDPIVDVYILDDDQPVQAGFESTTLSVTEGQSLVQVCAVIFNPTAIGTRTFTASVVASGGSAQGGGVDYGTLPTSTLTFTAANTRTCINISITDDSLVEGPELFSLSLSEAIPNFNLTVPSTIVGITDNDLGIFRFTQSSYIVNENAGELEVVMEIAPGSGTLTTTAIVGVQTVTGGTATEGDGGDYIGVSTDLTFTSSSGPGDSVPVLITILDDNLDEFNETILLEASILSGQQFRTVTSDQQFAQFPPGERTVTSDQQFAQFPPGGNTTAVTRGQQFVFSPGGDTATLTINDDDDFTLRWINDSPRVEGNNVTANLAIGASFQSVMCQVTTQPVQDCSSGSVTFTGLRPNQRLPFNFTVEGILMGPAGERVVIYRTFRIETITDCWLHLINDGITVTGDTVAVQWQATGPSADNRATMFRCALDGRTRDCQPSQGFTVRRLFAGNHDLAIRPTDPACTRRRIQRRFQFRIL